MKELNYGEDHVLKVDQTATAAVRQKAAQMREMMDRSLGATESRADPASECTFLYLRGGRLIGCLVAERIKR